MQIIHGTYLESPDLESVPTEWKLRRWAFDFQDASDQLLGQFNVLESCTTPRGHLLEVFDPDPRLLKYLSEFSSDRWSLKPEDFHSLLYLKFGPCIRITTYDDQATRPKAIWESLQPTFPQEVVQFGIR